MKKFRQILASPVTTVILFVAAAGLLLFSTIGGARAAWLAVSDSYFGHVEVYDIGVTLLEESENSKNGPQRVAFRDYKKNSQDEWDEVESKTWGKGVGDLLQDLVAEGEEFRPGKPYKEEISVKNSGTINEYVRVTILKYWTDPSGNKVFTPADKTAAKKGNTTQGLSPDLIKLNYINQDDGTGKGDWILDPLESSETEERTVFYYNKLLKSGEDTTKTPLTDTLTIDQSVADKVTKKTVETTEDGYKVIRTSYDYDGWRFNVEAHVDAVQERHAEDAIRSAWGRSVTFREDGTLQLVNSANATNEENAENATNAENTANAEEGKEGEGE